MYTYNKIISLLEQMKYENQLQNRLMAPKPHPPHLSEVTITPVSASDPQPKWRDKNGVLYGSHGRDIYKSEDEGDTWDFILAVPSEYDSAWAILVSDTGRIIASTGSHLIVTNEEQTDWESEPAAEFLAGRIFRRFGQTMYDNVIAVSTYGGKGTMNPPRQAFLSLDYGATWTEIYNEKIEDMADPTDYHLHDIEYDPYTGRLWLHVSDGANRQLKYSEDWGQTWVSVYDEPGQIMNHTNLMATPYGLLLGTDASTPGINILPNDDEFIRYRIPAGKVRRLVGLVPNGVLSHYATRHWVDRERPLYLMPFLGQGHGGTATLLASADALNWYHIYTHPTPLSRFLNIIGPKPGDEPGYVHSTMEIGDSTYRFRGKMPVFK